MLDGVARSDLTLRRIIDLWGERQEGGSVIRPAFFHISLNR